jgi:hypothetical protein
MHQIQPWAQVAQYETNTWPTTSSSLLHPSDHLDVTASGIDELGPGCLYKFPYRRQPLAYIYFLTR